MPEWKMVQCVNGPYDGMGVRVSGMPNLVYMEPLDSLSNLVEEFLNIRIRREIAVYHLKTDRNGKMYYEFHEIREMKGEL